MTRCHYQQARFNIAIIFILMVTSLACRCAKIAREKGYKVFGLQSYGECWSGPSAEKHFDKYGKADPSKSFQFIGNPPLPCDKTKAQECIGGPLINYVYRLKKGKYVFAIVKCLSIFLS